MFAPYHVDEQKRDLAFQFLFGRQPDRIGFEGEPNLLRLPAVEFVKSHALGPKGLFITRKRLNGEVERSGVEIDADGKSVERPARAWGTKAESNLLRYHSGGFRRIDAKSLVSPVAVIEPETWPGEAGLIQLERAGAIREGARDDIDAYAEGVSRRYRTKLTPGYRMQLEAD